MDFGDGKAWDDSELINTWDEALEEYKVYLGDQLHGSIRSLTLEQKYHSRHLSGKRLEDVLSKEEMAQVIA